MYTNDFNWWHQIEGFSKKLDRHKIPEEDGSNYKVNSYDFRCDEFTTIHKGNHVLFSGCSNTYGVGLKKEEVWAYQVYNRINKESSCSGYFNIGLKGNNIINSILNIFKYCKKFGNPDIIFINLPSQNRFFNFDEKEKKYRIVENLSISKIHYIEKLTFYNYYLMLEQYCSSNKIKLFSFTWDTYDQHSLNKNINKFYESVNVVFKNYNFKTFYYINEEEMLNNLFLLKQKYNNKFFDIARDNMHRGTGAHMYWSDFIYNKYVEENQNLLDQQFVI
jgi:hypothetical protein